MLARKACACGSGRNSVETLGKCFLSASPDVIWDVALSDEDVENFTVAQPDDFPLDGKAAISTSSTSPYVDSTWRKARSDTHHPKPVKHNTLTVIGRSLARLGDASWETRCVTSLRNNAL